jgi:hypothetical protein
LDLIFSPKIFLPDPPGFPFTVGFYESFPGSSPARAASSDPFGTCFWPGWAELPPRCPHKYGRNIRNRGSFLFFWSSASSCSILWGMPARGVHFTTSLAPPRGRTVDEAGPRPVHRSIFWVRCSGAEAAGWLWVTGLWVPKNLKMSPKIVTNLFFSKMFFSK